MTILFGAYQRRNQVRNRSLSKFSTVLGVPRIGRPSGCAFQKCCVNNSWTRSSGLSSVILISSRITDFSRAMSSSSNLGDRTRSDKTSKASGKCSSSTLALKQTISLEVKASSIPPTRSISRAICSAERRSVPLKTMCSMKWEMPLISAGSRREPERIQMPMETERICGMGCVITTRPFGSTVFSIERNSLSIFI